MTPEIRPLRVPYPPRSRRAARTRSPARPPTVSSPSSVSSYPVSSHDGASRTGTGGLGRSSKMSEIPGRSSSYHCQTRSPSQPLA